MVQSIADIQRGYGTARQRGRIEPLGLKRLDMLTKNMYRHHYYLILTFTINTSYTI